MGLDASPVSDAVVTVTATPAPASAIERVHPGAYLGELMAVDAAGGGRIDGDTTMNEHSLEAARLAAGAGLDAIDRLRAGDSDAAFCVVRPPGHHATSAQSMGFCLVNSAAVAAAALVDAGERVAIIDYDAHHGNGTEEIFYRDAEVLYVSLHQSPFYPGTGSATDRGSGAGVGTTVNVPLPAGATGDVYRAALDRIIGPALDAFAPTWLILSAGFDAHRADPLTDLGLTSADYADLTRELLAVAPAGRRLVFLEGGYDLQALVDSTASVAAELLGEQYRSESPTSGGPGLDVVQAIEELHRREAHG